MINRDDVFDFPMNYSNRHLRFGWWLLLVSLSLGLVLEALHGFKLGWYLDVTNETRQLMLTLAHAHGTLLALVNIAAGLTARGVAGFTLRPSSPFSSPHRSPPTFSWWERAGRSHQAFPRRCDWPHAG